MAAPTTKPSTRLLGWLAGLAAVLALAAGLWYAQAHNWLTPAYHWLHHLASGHGDGMDQGSMGGMNMPGMDMGSPPMGRSNPSSVPDHAEVVLPGEVQQRIGVTVGRVEEAPLRMSVRTVGIVQPNEKNVAHVHLKTEGWIEKLFVDYTGQQVKKGDPLLSLYSREFLTTQQDYVRELRTEGGEAAAGPRQSLATASRRRLELWDVPREEIEELARTGRPQTYLTLRSPIAGTVLAKNAFAGQYVGPQNDLYVVADLSTVWVQAKVYEYELPHVEEGQPAAVTTQALPDRTSPGKVVFVQPTVEEPARTVQVRVELPNPDGLLKPGMFTQVVIQHHMGNGLLIPTSAVIRTGERDIAYRVEAPDKFLPVWVKISQFRYEDRHDGGGRFQVLEGLKAGDEVVTSANFLIDSESRLRAGGMGSMPGMPGMDMGGSKGAGQDMGDMKGMKH
jgi:Cu(I)/Ag(I) efflux system membrane fusion protein